MPRMGEAEIPGFFPGRNGSESGGREGERAHLRKTVTASKISTADANIPSA